VTKTLQQRILRTLSLALLATFFAAIVGVGLGVLAAV
jgi:ABC-type dipeptide/oligopeptide/nickel transport system permease component